MQRNGSIQNQLFMYIMTMIVISLLLYFSFTWIAKLIEQEKDMEYMRFKSTIELRFETIAANDGSYEYAVFSKPSFLGKICFLDLDKYTPLSNLCNEASLEYSPFICDIWKDGNLNIVVEEGRSEIIIPRIEVQKTEGYICFDADKNNFKVKLEGSGNKLIVG